MSRLRYAACLWPGLPDLWRAGDWSALATACGFAAVLNLAMATSLVWTDLVGSMLRTGLWIGISIVWLMAAFRGFLTLRRPATRGRRAETEEAFAQAQHDYLKGNWYAAETVLKRMLRTDARDVDSHFLLAGVLRHAGRYEESEVQLKQVERLEGGERWQWEIARERQRIAQLKEEAAELAAEQAESEAALAENNSAQNEQVSDDQVLNDQVVVDDLLSGVHDSVAEQTNTDDVQPQAEQQQPASSEPRLPPASPTYTAPSDLTSGSKSVLKSSDKPRPISHAA